MPQQRSYFSLTNTMAAPPAVGPWPGTTTQNNLDWEKSQQEQMQAALAGLGTLATQAEAAQFARQQESQAAQAQYLAAVNGPANMAPPLSMALPYAAAQFSSALSGQPQVGEQANQSLALNRAMQLQRRSQVLEQLASQTQEAARRAESAGDLTNALKFNTKANLYLKQIEEAGSGLHEARKTAIDQTFDAWRTMYTARADYLSRLVSSGAASGDPKLAARLFALKEQHDTEAKALEKQIETTPTAKRGPLQSQLDDINNRYTRLVEGALSGEPIYEPPPPPPPPGPAVPPKPTLIERGVGAAKSFLNRRSMREQVPEARAFLLQQFGPAAGRKAILEALNTVDPASGKRLGEIIADRHNFSFDGLRAGARSIGESGPETMPPFYSPPVGYYGQRPAATDEAIRERVERMRRERRAKSGGGGRY